MDKVCWLHISDWHQRGSDFEEDRRFVRNRLIEDIENRRKLNSVLGQLDFVVFSGDLAFSGKESEYRTAGSEFLDPVLKAAELSKENLFLVPGNHDVDRDELKYLAPFLDLVPDRDHVTAELSTPESRARFLIPMGEYIKFCKSYLGSMAPAEPAYSQLRELKIGGRTLAILGLNSAWMCGQKKEGSAVNDYGYLILGEPQMNQHFDQWKKAEVRLAVLHHPFEWLSTVEDRGRIRRALTRSCHFLLRGHEHDPELQVPAAGTAGNYALLSAGAAYDRRDNPFRPNGYNLVCIDFEQNQGTVYLRRYDSEQRKFVADSSVTGDETPGIASFVLPAELDKTSVKAQKPVVQTLRGDEWSVQNPATMRHIAEIYRAQHAGSLLDRISTTLTVQMNCLRDESEPDLITFEQTFRPAEDPVYCVKLSIFSSSGDFLGDSKWGMYDEISGSALKTIPLYTYEIPESPSSDEKPIRSLVIHFDPVLRVGTGPYRLEYKEWVRNGMANLRSGKDELFVFLSRSRQPVSRVNLVVKVPKAFGPVEMRPSSRKNAVTPGELMEPSEIRPFDDLPGFYALGWKGKDVGIGEFAVDLVKVPVVS
jgi:predicted phosphodiesterase